MSHSENFSPESVPSEDNASSMPVTPKSWLRAMGRWLKWVVWGGLVGCLLAVAVVLVAAHTERGTRAIWRVTHVVTSGAVQAQWLDGTLARGGSAQSLHIHVPTLHLDFSALAGQWRFSFDWGVLPVRWHVDQLSVERLDVAVFASDKAPEPLQTVRLPLGLTVQQLDIAQLNVIQGLNTQTFLDVAAGFESDRINHRLILNHVRQSGAEYSGQLSLQGKRPFALSGNVAVGLSDEYNDYRAGVVLKGDLQRLNLVINANSEAQSPHQLVGKGDVTVQLLDGLYIHEGVVDIKHVNPKLFWSSLPQANLDFKLNAVPISEADDNLSALEYNSRKSVDGRWSVTNHLPLTLADLGVPIVSGQGAFKLSDRRQTLDEIELKLLDGGLIHGQGAFARREGTIDLQVENYNLKTIHKNLLSSALAGTLNIAMNTESQRFLLNLKQNRAPSLAIESEVWMSTGLIDVKHAKVSGVGKAQLVTEGQIRLTEKMPFTGRVLAEQFNLRDLGDFPSSQLAGVFDMTGQLKPAFKVDVKGVLLPSRWGEVAANGQVDVGFEMPNHVVARKFDVRIGSNHFVADGHLGQVQDRLRIAVDAPNLNQLQFGFAGRLRANGTLSGALSAPRGQIELQGDELAFFGNRISSIRGSGQWEVGETAPMNATLNVQGYDVGPVHLKALEGKLSGTQAAHQYQVRYQGNIHVLDGQTVYGANGAQVHKAPVQWILDGDVVGSGGFKRDAWQGQLTQLNNRGQPNVQLQQPVHLAYESRALQMNDLVAQVQDAQLRVERFSMQGQRIDSRGSVSNLVVQRWLSWLSIPMPFYPSDDFAIKGQWDIVMGSQPAGGFSFERERGDVALDARRKNLIHLSNLDFKGQMVDRHLNLVGQLNGADIGENRIQGRLGLVNSSAGWVVSGLSPLDVNVSAHINALSQFNHLLGVNVRLNGQAQADLNLKGTLSAWTPRGVVTAQGLEFYELDQGLRITDGVARIRVESSRLVFEQFEAKGVSGRLSVQGTVGWGAQQGVNASLSMFALRPFARPDREVVLSGVTQLGFDGINQFTMSGQVNVDKALIDMPPFPPPSLGNDVRVVYGPPPTSELEGVFKQTKPTQAERTANLTLNSGASNLGLSSDVQVQSSSVGRSQSVSVPTRAAKPSASGTRTKSAPVVAGAVNPATKNPARSDASTKPQAAYVAVVDLDLNLGDQFRFKGQGADVLMTGHVKLRSTPANPDIQANGTVKISKGTYLFYGQTLTIQRGLVTFLGPLDDPSVNILANRTINSTEVGVEVSGTLADTRARLVSSPEMPDEEKLAWMLFGRSTAELSGNDISSIAGAASLLLSSDQGRKFTERFGIDSVNVGAVGTNAKGGSGTYVGVGKQITDKFGVAYEQGIDTISSILRVTWSLSRSWQVGLRGGTANGIDLQYRKRFDRIQFGKKSNEKP